MASVLHWWYSADASTVTEITDRVPVPGPASDGPGISVGRHAEEGSGWEGELLVRDPTGTFLPLVLRRVYATQEAEASGNQVIGNWFISNIKVKRGSPFVGAARDYYLTMADENSLLSRRRMVGSDANRGSESDIARIRWMLSTTELNVLSPDETYIDTTGPVTLDAADLRQQSCEEILSTIKDRSGKNYFVRYAEAAAVGGAIVSSSVANPTVITTSSAHGLTTGMQVTIAGHSGSTPSINGTHTVTVTGATTYTIPVNVTVGGTGGTSTTVGRYVLCYFNFSTNTTLLDSGKRISNVASEIDHSTTFAMWDDAELNRSAGRSPMSGLIVPWKGSWVYVQNAAVGTAHAYRDAVAKAPNVTTAASATAQGTRQLAELDEPEDEITDQIRVTAAQLNDVKAGDLIQYHCSYKPGYQDDFVPMRVKRRTIVQVGPNDFDVPLTLVPVEVPCEAQTTYTVPTPSGNKMTYFWELTGVTTTPIDSLAVTQQNSTGTFNPGNLDAAGTEAEVMLLFGYAASGQTDSDGPGGFNLGGNFSSSLLTIDFDEKQLGTYNLPESIAGHRLLTSPTAGGYAGTITYGGQTYWGANALAFAGSGITIRQQGNADGLDGTDQMYVTLPQAPLEGSVLVFWVTTRLAADQGSPIGLPSGWTGLTQIDTHPDAGTGRGGRMMYWTVTC